MTTFVVISDTHGFHEDIKLPDGDVLLHCGDFSGASNWDSVRRFNDWGYTIEPLFKHRVCICGNHELQLESLLTKEDRQKELSNWTYLEHDMTTIDGINIYGEPSQPRFFDWAWNVERGSEKMKKIWASIPEETHILMSHGPPKGILDKCPAFDFDQRRTLNKLASVGCEDMRNEIFSGRLKNLKKVVFGHIHHSHGWKEENGITFINAAVCTEKYKPTQRPFVFGLNAN